LAEAIRFGMIGDARSRFIRPLQEALMSTAKVLRFSENFDTMTYGECQAFIERSRRQIDRLEHLPQEPGELDMVELVSIRQGLDDLEKRIRSHPGNIHS
jgi:hypothetical protein